MKTVKDLRAPDSHSTGHDNISMNMIKRTINTMAPSITHLTTQIIRKRTFPDTFKIDKITPKHKSETHIRHRII